MLICYNGTGNGKRECGIRLYLSAWFFKNNKQVETIKND
jgi:hypothetical protein